MDVKSAVSSSPDAYASCIKASRNGPVGTLTLDNLPKHNAMSFDMWQDLPLRLRELDEDPEIRVIVLQGAGEKAFASGSDISQFGERRNTPEGVALYNGTVERAVAALATVRKPTIARIRGYCFGGGVGMALHCDLRYATPDATFCIPAGKVGVGYNETWLQRLAWLVGPANAKEIMLTARRYKADEALRIGLINDIADDAQVEQTLQTIAGLAPLTHLASKLAIDTATAVSERGREACQQAIRACFASKDYIEGRDAFTQKRTPRFTGT
ncbi:enoyl-CoA hydratase [Bordetella sp. N]|uniref:enoyl-CoA hydratase n=1 Tax=Bordetella sp. N TaxID=1746199 RepID=UPI00070EE54E|nr:enoyl-CoA hydratase [Bordetella sp. N]ALM81671.1 hypothetical protein ASB57_00635 [Bordetella sp. N]